MLGNFPILKPIDHGSSTSVGKKLLDQSTIANGTFAGKMPLAQSANLEGAPQDVMNADV